MPSYLIKIILVSTQGVLYVTWDFRIFLLHICLMQSASMVQAEDSWSSHKLLQMPDCPRAVLWRLFVHEVRFFFRLISHFSVNCGLVLLLDRIKHRVINYIYECGHK